MTTTIPTIEDILGDRRPFGQWYEAPSGLAVPESYVRRQQRPTCVDLFCGIGGFSLGFIQAGFHVVAGLEYDEFAALTYLHNLGEYGNLRFYFATEADRERLEAAIRRQLQVDEEHGLVRHVTLAGQGWISGQPGTPGVRHMFFGDVRRFSGQQILEALDMKPGDLDCVIGGPPCQGFSTSGKREVMDPRNSLVFEFARLITELKPRTFVMENVPGILSMQTPHGVPVVDQFCQLLEEGGYGKYESLKRAMELQGEQYQAAAVAQHDRTETPTRRTEPGQLSLFGQEVS